MQKQKDSYTELKIRLLEKGYRSLRNWCKTHGFPYKLTYAVITNRTPAKSGKALKIKEALVKEFGKDVLNQTQIRREV